MNPRMRFYTGCYHCDATTAPRETLSGTRLCQRCYERYVVEREPIRGSR